MRITREKHLASIVRLMPWILIGLGIQAYAFLHWAPTSVVIDVSIFSGIGLSLVAISMSFYDHFHQVRLHRNYLHVSYPLVGHEEEILYRDIEYMDIEVSKHAYYNVTLTLRAGESLRLNYLDDVQDLKSYVKQIVA
jgi:hypothetical protein